MRRFVSARFTFQNNCIDFSALRAVVGWAGPLTHLPGPRRGRFQAVEPDLSGRFHRCLSLAARCSELSIRCRGLPSSMVRAFCPVLEASSPVFEFFYWALEVSGSVFRAFCSGLEASSSMFRACCPARETSGSMCRAFCLAQGLELGLSSFLQRYVSLELGAPGSPVRGLELGLPAFACARGCSRSFGLFASGMRFSRCSFPADCGNSCLASRKTWCASAISHCPCREGPRQ